MGGAAMPKAVSGLLCAFIAHAMREVLVDPRFGERPC
jgi:hypothetical protein